MLICCRRIRAGRFPVSVRPHPDGFGAQAFIARSCTDEFGAHDVVVQTCMDEFGVQDAAAQTCTDEFGAQNAVAQPCMNEFGAQNAAAQPCMNEFGAPNAYLSAAERKYVVPNAHLSGDESLSATTLRGLGAAAPSGAGESGWFGGRKPPLPSRGVVSLQDVPPASKREENPAGRNPRTKKAPKFRRADARKN